MISKERENTILINFLELKKVNPNKDYRNLKEVNDKLSLTDEEFSYLFYIIQVGNVVVRKKLDFDSFIKGVEAFDEIKESDFFKTEVRFVKENIDKFVNAEEDVATIIPILEQVFKLKNVERNQQGFLNAIVEVKPDIPLYQLGLCELAFELVGVGEKNVYEALLRSIVLGHKQQIEDTAKEIVKDFSLTTKEKE